MSANWFDHAIATVAPRMAARRVMARQAFETLTRGYDGAARGRRTEGWRAPGSSADTEIGVAGALLRDRMRDLVRNNPHAAKAVAVLVNNIIGAGIMPRAASGDDTLDRKVDALWRAPGSSADTEIGVAGALLRDRMRDLVRNNPHAAKAVADSIGAGIMPRAASGDDTLDREGRRPLRASAGRRTATPMANSTSTACRR
jgi:capsid protein